MLFKKWVVSAFLLMSTLSCLAATPAKVTPPAPIVAGKDYQEVTPADPALLNVKPSEVSVTEFFSFGCPACFHFEPVLEKWLKKKHKTVNFERVPVEFHEDWTQLAKIYYAANTLDVSEKIAPLIFNAIHVKHESITSETLKPILKAVGISSKDFDSALNFSPGIDARLNNGRSLSMAYQITEVPTLLVNGKYMINPAMSNGDTARMIQVLDFVIKKAQTQK